MNEIHSKIKDILKGIDKRSADDENGWWETNSQEDFGKNILKRINLLFSEVPKQQSELTFSINEFNDNLSGMFSIKNCNHLKLNDIIAICDVRNSIIGVFEYHIDKKNIKFESKKQMNDYFNSLTIGDLNK